MKYSHWELLLAIYQSDKPLKLQCHKALIKTCIKNNWVRENNDGIVEVTDKGIEEAKEIAPLYKHEFSNMGQTY